MDIMVAGMVSASGGLVNNLYFVEPGCKVDSVEWCQIMQNWMLPAALASTPRPFCCIVDNAPSHSSKMTRTWLAAENSSDRPKMEASYYR